MLIFIYTVFHQSFPVSWCCRFRTRNGIDCMYYYHLVDIPAGGLIVPNGIIRTLDDIIEIWLKVALNTLTLTLFLLKTATN
jgi:hypothetical protein